MHVVHANWRIRVKNEQDTSKNWSSEWVRISEMGIASTVISKRVLWGML
jgi:hypothetical protein